MDRRKISRVISLILMLSLLFTSNAVVMAAESIPSDTAGNEVEKISSAKELKKMAENLSGDYILTKDIDLKNAEWLPIGNNQEPFTGTLNGNGHVISNLNILIGESKEGETAGLFGVIDGAEISELALENADIKVETTEGISAGILAGKMKNSVVEDCYVSGKIEVINQTVYTIGGIAGAVFQETNTVDTAMEYNISRCIADVEIVNNVAENGESGIIAGYVENTALVCDSYSYKTDSALFGIEIGNTTCSILGAEKYVMKAVIKGLILKMYGKSLRVEPD